MLYWAVRMVLLGGTEEKVREAMEIVRTSRISFIFGEERRRCWENRPLRTFAEGLRREKEQQKKPPRPEKFTASFLTNNVNEIKWKAKKKSLKWFYKKDQLSSSALPHSGDEAAQRRNCLDPLSMEKTFNWGGLDLLRQH